MPIYDYRCDACGNAFTALQSWHDEPLERCPECGARPRRLISLPAIVFKGSGFHVNDYARKGAKNGEAKPGGDKKSSETAPKTDAAATE